MNTHPETATLATAFSEFISASASLEDSYRQLQAQVYDLRQELNNSRAENQRMRLDLQQIVDSMPCGVLVLDRAGDVSLINPESIRLLEIRREQVSGRSKKLLCQIAALSESAAKSDTGQEFCLQDESGKRWIEVRNRQLSPEQTILILRDVTLQRRAEQEREAGRKAMALAEISTVLAHEIRNPLASLELFAELVENDAERRAEWISNLRCGIRSLSATVNNVLSFHSSGSLKLAPLCLSDLLEQALQFVGPLADQAAVSLQRAGDDLAPLDMIHVLANQGALQQVILNLAANAIRHTPPGGLVTVHMSLDDENGQVTVAFHDTGSGIRADQIDHIFEPGFSGSGDTSGLGLAVCRRIMRQHGGDISVANGPECGARFTLHFPPYRLEQARA